MRIYFEPQESALCGQHCLNNLLQGHLFAASDLSDIALALDAQERAMGMTSGSSISHNVDESGNFSIQVIRTALKMYSIELLSWSSSDERLTDPLKEELGFIINRQSHWFALRKINGKWWNLNSTLERPQHISPLHLSALLSQLREENFFVFIARGNPPSVPVESSLGGSAAGRYFEEQSLLGEGGQKPSGLVPFSGMGHRLGGVDQTSSSEDADLSRAIALSLGVVVDEEAKRKSAKEEMRAKRLAALGMK